MVLSPFREAALRALLRDYRSRNNDMSIPFHAVPGNKSEFTELTSEFLRSAQGVPTHEDDLLHAGEAHFKDVKLEDFLQTMKELSPIALPNDLRFDFSAEMADSLVDELMARETQALDAVAAVPAGQHTFENTVQVLADEEAATGPICNALHFLQHVSPSDTIRDISRKSEAILSQFAVDAQMRVDVYESIQAFAATDEAKALTGERKRLLERLLRDYRRRGLHLPAEQKERVRELNKEISTLCIDFSSHLGEEDTTVLFTCEELAGVPDDKVKSFKVDEATGKRVVTLKPPDYSSCMKNCSVEETRRKLEYEYNRRCLKENTEILERLVALRAELADLLGFPDHCAFQLDVLMAKEPKRVRKFLKELANKLKDANTKELAKLLELKREEKARLQQPCDGKLNAWDRVYYCRKLEELEYKVDKNVIKDFFPLGTVTMGLLSIYQSLLGLTFRQMGAEEAHVWHEDVLMFEVTDTATKEFMGHFYLDLHSRPGKYSHAACFGLQSSLGGGGGGANPRPRRAAAVAIVANFSSPTPDKPSLLDHDEVETFFHEFGHAAHGFCSKATYPRFAGTAVERDFVEAPSQMLENWCWEVEPLRKMSGHYMDPSFQLPAVEVAKLIASKNANAAIDTMRQIVFALFDQEIHSSEKADTAETYARLQWEIAGIEATPGTNFAAGFGHLAGGYDARYYGYLWSEVFSADMFESQFKKKGLFSPEVGARYRRCILEPGGSRDANDMLADFLGRAPSVEPFLASKGVQTDHQRRRRLRLAAAAAAAAAAVAATVLLWQSRSRSQRLR